MTYTTGNPLGSADPRDLYDNAEALDRFVNSTDATYTNRLSVSKPTLTDLVADANQALADVQAFIDGDIALIGAAVYVDEPTGRAAVADGEAFKVQGSGDIAAYEYRRVNSGSSTLIATYPASAFVQTQADKLVELGFVSAANLYDPTLAEDGYLYNYTTGTKSSFATCAISGHIPVIENTTYTITQVFREKGIYPHVWCWDRQGTYLGMDALISGNPVISGMNVVASDAYSSGYRRLTFTVPSGSDIAFIAVLLIYPYASHSTDEFNRIKNNTQMALGSDPGDFNVYSGIYDSTYLDPLIDAFDYTAQRNLFSGYDSIDGYLINYASGKFGAYANGMAFGYFKVVANTTYCVTMGDPLGFTPILYCKDSSKNYLGIDHTYGGTTGMENPPTSIVWTGGNQVVFTIPAGSAIAFVGLMAAFSAHTTDDFNRVQATIQVEVGSTPTAYQPYSPRGHAVLKTTSLPSQTTEEESGILTPDWPVHVTKIGNDVYVRGALSTSYDIVNKVSLSSNVNSTVNITETRKVSNTIDSVITAFSSGTAMAVSTDDAAPLYYNGTYIGANHGANFVILATVTSHGKTVEDVGSTWSDGSAVWTILKIVDSNRVWLLSANQSSYPAWSFLTSLGSNTLLHVANATHTDTMTVSASSLTQLTPALQRQTATVYLDGKTTMADDGDAAANSVHIVNSYSICNPASVLAYVQSQVGSSVQPDLNHNSIATDVRRTVTYAFAANGSCTITDGVYFTNAVTLGYFGVTQATALPLGSGETLWQYIPRVSGITNGIKTWQFQATENISGTFAEIHIATANFTDANNPPDRMAQIVKNSGGTKQHGLMLGYSPVRSIGVPATRATLISEACFLSSIRKQYPKAVTVTSQPAGSYYEAIAFRAFWDASANSSATCCAWYQDGNAIILMADFHQIVAFLRLTVPLDWTGRTITVVRKTSTVTVHGNSVVADGIRVSSSATYGELVLALT